MPILSDFEELDLTGMDIDRVDWIGDKIVKRFPGGFRASAIVGPLSGRHGFTLSSGCLPDDVTISPIDSVSRFEYYYEFFKARTLGAQEIFVIEWRSKKWHVAFTEPQTSYERFTDDLFAGGVSLEGVRVKGVTYNADGSIFDPSLIEGVWTWYQADEYSDIDGSIIWYDVLASGRNLSPGDGTNVTQIAAVVNGLGVFRLNSGATNDGFLITTQAPVIYHAFFLMKVNEATFSNFGGLLTADFTAAAMVAQSGTTKLNDLSLSGYTYRLNGVTYAANDQQMPMNEFGVVHGHFNTGAGLPNLQIGKDRDFAGRFLEAEFAEIVLCDGNISAADAATMNLYLMNRGDITA